MDPTSLPPPFKIKTVEKIRQPEPDERRAALERASYNPFNLRSDEVYIDLLTDSGTGAMSDRQWGALMVGDESYAGSRSFDRLHAVVKEIFGFPHLLVAHQGRGAEGMFFRALLKSGDVVPGNCHFDTTRAHIEDRGAIPLDLVPEEAWDPTSDEPFKGNLDLARLEELLGAGEARVPLVLVTVTCNPLAGHPVSVENLKALRALADRYATPVFLDAARFAENAFLIKRRQPGYQDRPIREIINEMVDVADGILVSAKKDGLVNIGGFVAVRDQSLCDRIREFQILQEGFPTYGGLAGRDLEAMAVGLEEGIDEAYLAHRVGQVAWLAERLTKVGIPVVKPPGGHGVYVDAGAFLSHLTADQYPGHALACALYLEAGVRAVEVGTLLAGRDPETGEDRHPPLELLRLAIPRRVYTQEHLEVVACALEALHARSAEIPGMALVHEPPRLRHFTATFRPLST